MAGSTGYPKRPAANADPKPIPVHLLYGNDEYRVAAEARRLADLLCPREEQALGMEEIDGAADTPDGAVRALRECLAAVQTVGFFNGRKLVWFRDVAFLKNPRVQPSKAVKAWTDRLTETIRAGLPPGHRLLISARGMDGRSALAKACGASGRVSVFDVPAQRYRLTAYAEETALAEFERAGLRASPPAVKALVTTAGFDSRAIHQEVEKLASRLGRGGEVRPEDVASLVADTRESTGWELADALFARNLDLSLSVLRRLASRNEEPVALLGFLDARCREALLLIECRARRWLRPGPRGVVWKEGPDIEKALGPLGARDPRRMHPYRAIRILEDAEAVGGRKLERWRVDILRVREQAVSSATPPELLLEILAVSLLGRDRG